MTLADKREVIEVLLCGWRDGCYCAANQIGVRQSIATRAKIRRWRIINRRTGVEWELAAIEAAYRLIESSPTLVREWFGRGAA